MQPPKPPRQLSDQAKTSQVIRQMKRDRERQRNAVETDLVKNAKTR